MFFWEVFRTKQQKNEPSWQYIYKVKDVCKQFDSNMDEQTKLFLICEGIDDRLKNRITMMNPLSFDETVFAAKVAEEGQKQAYEAKKQNKNDNHLMKMLWNCSRAEWPVN